MTLMSDFKQRYGKLLSIGAVCALTGFGTRALAENTKPMIVTPLEEARLVPLDPARPDGPRIAVLWGDPDQGPSAMLLEIARGAGRLHVHTSDYHLVVLEGTMKHWAEEDQEADAKPLGPGSYWFQPGSQAHGDTCLTDKCLMFVKWEGRRDARLAQP